MAATEAAHKSQTEKLSQIQAELASAQAEADALKQKFEEQKKAVEAVEKAMPAFTMVMAADEATPTELPIHIRGNHLTLAKEKVIRGVPEILATAVPLQEIPEKQSGRLQLAHWMVSPENPLTARVMVNRIILIIRTVQTMLIM